jgi:uncharacterized coiled-coil protein SlyX
MGEFLGSENAANDQIAQYEKQLTEQRDKIAAMSDLLAEYAGEIAALKIKIKLLELHGNHID